MDLSTLLTVLPEKYRPAVALALEILATLQVLASVVVQALPAASMEHPRFGTLVRVLHRFGHMRFRDEPGTLKLPGAAPTEPPEVRLRAELKALRDSRAALERAASTLELAAGTPDPPRATTPPPESAPEAPVEPPVSVPEAIAPKP